MPPVPFGDDLPHNLPSLPVASIVQGQSNRASRGDSPHQGHVSADDVELAQYPSASTPPARLESQIPLLQQTRDSINSAHDDDDDLLPPEAYEAYEASQDESEIDETHMNKRTTRRSKRASQPNGSTSSPHTDPDSPDGDMNVLEQRRKHAVLSDRDSATQTASLIDRDTFTLDEEPEPTPGGAGADLSTHNPSGESHGFFELPRQDRRNFLLLVLLYFLQGVPMGLAGGSVPFLLKSHRFHLSYAQIGVFSLASYPYSLKLLWSPIVDAVWSPKVGRRKSWILPVQMFSGLGMLWLGARAEEMMIAAGADGGAGVWGFTGRWFFLVFTCATQDIAVDGWALTLLSHKHIAYASTAQTVGLTGGQFLSYTVFLAFESPDFANKWFRSKPIDEGVMTLGGYLTFWGWAYLLVTIGLAVLKREEKTKNREGIWEVYKVMGGILKLKNIQTIIIIHLIAKIGFQANDAVTNLKLLDKGFSQEDLALTVLIDFPFELALGYYAGKWSSAYPPMHLWCWAFIGRLVAAAFAQFVVMIFPAGGVTTWYLVTVIIEHVFSTFMSTIMFVAIAAFHAKIADPLIGGTYMTLLATVSNLGGTFPRYFVLRLVEYFTSATCHPPSTMAAAAVSALKKGATPPAGPPVTQAFSCVLESEKTRCVDGGGTCSIERDGYYIVNVICIVIGVVTFVAWIRPKSLHLQTLPLRAWRIAGGGER